MATTQSSLSEPEYRNGYNDLRYEKDNGLVEMFFTWHKRLNRWRYFKRALVLGLVATILLMIIVSMTNVPSSEESAIVSGSLSGESFGLSTVGSVLFMLVLAVFSVSHYMLMIRRLHDLNKTGWLCLLVIVPVINFFFSLYVLFAPGTVGSNDYGADPIECVE